MGIVQCDWCPYKKDLRTHRPQGSRCAWAEQGHVSTRRRGPAGSQGERPQKKPTLLTPLSWVCGLGNSEEIGFCGSHHQPWIFCHGSFSGVNPHPRHRAVCITPVLYLCALPPQPFLMLLLHPHELPLSTPCISTTRAHRTIEMLVI